MPTPDKLVLVSAALLEEAAELLTMLDDHVCFTEPVCDRRAEIVKPGGGRWEGERPCHSAYKLRAAASSPPALQALSTAPSREAVEELADAATKAGIILADSDYGEEPDLRHASECIDAALARVRKEIVDGK